MLRSAAVFLVAAIAAASFGFSGVAPAGARAAQLSFLVLLALAGVSLLLGSRRRRAG